MSTQCLIIFCLLEVNRLLHMVILPKNILNPLPTAVARNLIHKDDLFTSLENARLTKTSFIEQSPLDYFSHFCSFWYNGVCQDGIKLSVSDVIVTTPHHASTHALTHARPSLPIIPDPNPIRTQTIRNGTKLYCCYQLAKFQAFVITPFS